MSQIPFTNATPSACSRRDWLRTAARGTALVGLGALSGWLLLRQNQPCRLSIECRQCGRLSRCGLPEAIRAKQELRQ
jgi:hypothetical protein